MFDVIIPALNAQGSVAQAVSSAFTSGASTVFVVNDGSIDNTSAIATSAGATVITQSNAGASKARQRGAEMSDTDFIIFLDADDQLLTQGVHASLQLLKDDASLAAAGGGVQALLPNGRSRTLPRTYSGVIGTNDLISFGYGAWPPGAAVMRRDAYFASLENSLSMVSTHYAEDYEMFLRLSLIGNIFVHPTPAILYRIYDGRSSRDDLAPLVDNEIIRTHYAKATGAHFEPLSASQLQMSAHFRAARRRWAHGQHISAVRASLRGIQKNPAFASMKALQRLSRILSQ